MRRFKKGQYIQVQKNGFLGYIHEMDDLNYYLEWENRPGQIFNYATYEIDDGKDWVVSNKQFKYQALPAGNSPLVKPNQENCSHEFKLYVGFSQSYRYCTKCDKKLFLK